MNSGGEVTRSELPPTIPTTRGGMNPVWPQGQGVRSLVVSAKGCQARGLVRIYNPLGHRDRSTGGEGFTADFNRISLEVLSVTASSQNGGGCEQSAIRWHSSGRGYFVRATRTD